MGISIADIMKFERKNTGRRDGGCKIMLSKLAMIKGESGDTDLISNRNAWGRWYLMTLRHPYVDNRLARDPEAFRFFVQ